MKPRGFRQARCPGCGLTGATCVCTAYSRLESSIAISVVMTRSEARSASNSARLLSLWLPGVEVYVRGGPDEPGCLEQWVTRPGSALLFPGGAKPVPLPAGVRHLIVPDGTWAQARRIERRCFAPSGLPRVSLPPAWPSVYQLRRGREGLCTFEATALALGLLGHAPLAEALLERFVEWARRAQVLKAGGLPGAAAFAMPESRPRHPAIGPLCELNELSAAPSPEEKPARETPHPLQTIARGMASEMRLPQIHFAARKRE